MKLRYVVFLLVSVASCVFLLDLFRGDPSRYPEDSVSPLHVAELKGDCDECSLMYKKLGPGSIPIEYSNCFHAVHPSPRIGTRRAYGIFGPAVARAEQVRRTAHLEKVHSQLPSKAMYADSWIEKPFAGLNFYQAMELVGEPSCFGAKVSLIREADSTIPFDAYNLSLFFKDDVCIGAIQWEPNPVGKKLWRPRLAKNFSMTAVYTPPPGSIYTTKWNMDLNRSGVMSETEEAKVVEQIQTVERVQRVKHAQSGEQVQSVREVRRVKKAMNFRDGMPVKHGVPLRLETIPRAEPDQRLDQIRF